MSLAADRCAVDVIAEPVYSPIVERKPALTHAVHEWHFDAFSCSPDQLLAHVVEMFRQLGLLAHLSIDESVLVAFLTTLQQSYRAANPFHNFVHAFDVTQALFCLLFTFDLRRHLQPLEQLALMLAAIGHDAGHVGRTNAFLVATAHPLAVMYDGVSVLENHHCATTLQLLADSGLLQSFAVEDRRAVCQLIKTAILATDMANHQQWVVRIEEQLARGALLADRSLLSAALLKFCDITNVFRDSALAEQWMHRITDEYFAQGDEMPPPVPEMFDRSAARPRQQITVGFIVGVVKPFFERCIAPLLALEHAQLLRLSMQLNIAALECS